jgi:putative ABC transport system permease protein
MSKITRLIDLLKGKTASKATGISFRKFSVSLQLAFSIILIALVFVVMDQFNYMKYTNKGFNDRNLLVVKLRSDDPSLTSVFLDRLHGMTGVLAADGSSYFPGIIETKYVFQIETDKGMQETLIPMIHCGYEYLEALDVTFASGRGFSKAHPEDLHGGFIVNETAAKAFGWTDPIGKKIIGPVGGQGDFDREGTIIGVARDFNFATLHSKIEPLVIFLTNRSWGNPFIYVKTDPLRSAQLIPAIKKEFVTLWPGIPFEWEYLDSKYASLYKKDHDVKNIFEASLIISIIISCLSIFSMSALLTTLRYKELGIRKVVGASPAQLFLLQSRAFAEFLIISVLLAAPVIWWLSEQWLMTFAYHIPMSVSYFIIPALLAFTTIIVISAYHFIKGSFVNPSDILKYE